MSAPERFQRRASSDAGARRRLQLAPPSKLPGVGTTPPRWFAAPQAVQSERGPRRRWEIIFEREQPIVEKYSGLHNASAYVGMMPGRRLGVVILGNRGALYPSDAGRNILRELAER